MERTSYTTIGHRGLPICNPISSEKLDEVVDILGLGPDAGAVDLGCGKGELLIRIATRWGCAGLGIDTNAAFLAEASEALAARSPGGAVSFVEADARSYPLEAGSHDVACALGASDIFGGTAASLRGLADLVRPGGRVVLGEGFWSHPPDPAYLAATEIGADEMVSLADVVAAGTFAGLIPLHAVIASDDDWDRYEWAHQRNFETWAVAHPHHPDAAALLTRRRAWHASYLRWRGTMGFGLFLFARP